MNKKIKLYLLIVVNVLAWGYVGYKVYGALQGDDTLELKHQKTNIKTIEVNSKEDSITLALNYPDPFLKKWQHDNDSKRNDNTDNLNQLVHNVIQKTKPVPNTVKSTPAVTAISVVDIKYIGVIKNNDKGTQTAMLSINGKSVFIKQNDVIEGLSITKIYNDSIIAKKGKAKVVIKK